MSNALPTSWSATNLGEMCKFSGGSAFKEIYQGNANGDYPFIKVSDMNLSGNEKLITSSNNWIDQSILKEAKAKTFPKNSVVFAKVGAALLLNRRRILTRDTVIDNNMMAAMPFADDNHFLYFLLQDIDFGTFVQSGAVPSINQSQLEDIPVLVPPLPEQQKIASILTAVDDVIESTQVQINKLKNLKTGMMQELLTKGIGHTEFKGSLVGRIPKAWEVKQLGQLAKLERGRFSQRPRNDPAFYGGTIPFLQTGDVPKDSPYISTFTQTLNEKGLSVSKLFKQGTLVITIAATIGEIGMLKFNSCFPDSLVGIIVDEAVADRSFLLYSMRSRKYDLESLAPQTAQKNINLEILNSFMLATPTLIEQQLIGKSMEAIDQKIEVATQKYIHFSSIKKALMQDLLTGKVRVKVASQ
ncbi:restriction endonuclease subunit S [Undibacterium sp. CY18W]|uniref:Restriction endonuclease subunit S n=1 Tax=Undibacterium hunanense TaxID=2762292 RepID=A0ABR6ZZ75_9BURK|nr:restriction endonuclease subunit S [Undibacterium hunanense]MBC3921054.1 restriction endonuclease subunit S [Undibacterium hunanense]